MMKDVKKSFMLPDDQCERLYRNEYTGLKMLLAFVSISAYAREDLQKRLECVPHGKERMNMAVGGLRSVCNDLIGTVSRAQCRQIMGTMKDYDVRLIPKLTPGSTNIIMTREAGKELIDLARENATAAPRTATAAGSAGCTRSWKAPRRWTATGAG